MTIDSRFVHGRFNWWRTACDSCGAELPDQYTRKDAVDEARIAGWYVDEKGVLCPDCDEAR